MTTENNGLNYTHYSTEEIRQLLGKKTLSLTEMRDAIISCTLDVQVNRLHRSSEEKVRQTPVATVYQQGEELFREAFQQLDIPFADPSPEEMNEVLVAVAKNWKLGEMERDLAQGHRFLCQQLISKVIKQRDGA